MGNNTYQMGLSYLPWANVQLNCHNDLIYINKETCKVLKNSNLKCRTSCTYKHFDEICQVKKGQNFWVDIVTSPTYSFANDKFK
jgi:hypothetical protein